MGEITTMGVFKLGGGAYPNIPLSSLCSLPPAKQFAVSQTPAKLFWGEGYGQLGEYKREASSYERSRKYKEDKHVIVGDRIRRGGGG